MAAVKTEEKKVVEEVKVERLTWDLELSSIDSAKKLGIIKEVRGLTGLGLKEVLLIFIIFYNYNLCNLLVYYFQLYYSYQYFSNIFKAKETVESAPKILKKGIKLDEAEKLKEALEKIGCKISIV